MQFLLAVSEQNGKRRRDEDMIQSKITLSKDASSHGTNCIERIGSSNAELRFRRGFFMKISAFSLN